MLSDTLREREESDRFSGPAEVETCLDPLVPHPEQTDGTSRPGKWLPLEESYSDYTYVLSHNNMLPGEGSGTQPFIPHNDILPMEKFAHECTLSLAFSLTHTNTHWF